MQQSPPHNIQNFNRDDVEALKRLRTSVAKAFAREATCTPNSRNKVTVRASDLECVLKLLGFASKATK